MNSHAYLGRAGQQLVGSYPTDPCTILEAQNPSVVETLFGSEKLTDGFRGSTIVTGSVG